MSESCREPRLPATAPLEEVAFSHRAFEDLTLSELHDLLRLRSEVFVVEQGITVENEVDGRDPEAVHVIGRTGAGVLVATARLFFRESPVSVGRIAVARALRGRGVGRQLMTYVARRLAHRRAAMSAQAYLRGWYEQLGWEVVGAPYDEAGIPHLRMERPGTAYGDPVAGTQIP